MAKKISEGVYIVDLGLYIEDCQALILSDLHIGFEQSLIEAGVLVPRSQTKRTLSRIKHIVSLCKGPIRLCVLNGDIRHKFSRASQQEWKEVMQVLDSLESPCGKVIIVRGNHDTMISAIAAKKGIEVVREWRCKGFLVLHGDKEASLAGCDTVIIGHEHPAVSLHEGARVERFKCFLKGSFRGKELIVMPSFLPVRVGTDITKEARLSPFLQKDISSFEVFIVEDKVYPFGKLKSVGR